MKTRWDVIIQFGMVLKSRIPMLPMTDLWFSLKKSWGFHNSIRGPTYFLTYLPTYLLLYLISLLPTTHPQTTDLRTHQPTHPLSTPTLPAWFRHAQAITSRSLARWLDFQHSPRFCMEFLSYRPTHPPREKMLFWKFKTSTSNIIYFVDLIAHHSFVTIVVNSASFI